MGLSSLLKECNIIKNKEVIILGFTCSAVPLAIINVGAKPIYSDVNLDDFKGKLLILNFWATWCAPCREEMPSLDDLQSNSNFDNLKIFPINIGQENLSKSDSFFKEIGIQNLEIYFDAPITLAKKFSLRGIPTTILFNKKGEEFGRIMGSIDFNNLEFINWLKQYN